MGLVPQQEEPTFYISALVSYLPGLASDPWKYPLGSYTQLADFGSSLRGLWAEDIVLTL